MSDFHKVDVDEAGNDRPALPANAATGGGASCWRRLHVGVKIAVVVVVVVVAVVIGIVLTDPSSAGEPSCYSTHQQPLDRALCIQDRVPMIDGHNDLPWALRQPPLYDNTRAVDLRQPQPQWMTDIPRLREGKVGGVFWSVYVSCRMQHKDAVRATLEQIDVVHQMASAYPEALQLATSAADVVAAHKAGRVASLIGIEGGHQIDSSFGALRLMFNAGARYLTLTHVCDTPWATSASTGTRDPPGLTEFGRNIVREMNRLGMLVDLSHVDVDTMRDALNTTVAPVMYSHSSAFSLCAHDRNVRDELFGSIRRTGSLIAVNFFPPYVNCSETATLGQVADHIEYLVNNVGEDHVGFGSDFDGIPTTPVGLSSVADFPQLIAELISRGFTEERVKKIVGLNFLRVLQAAEDVAVQLQASVAPQEGLIFPNATCRSFF